MNKNLSDYPLLELLDVKSLLQDYPIKEKGNEEDKERNEAIGKIFDAIAIKLFNEYHIKKGDSTYDFLEIEFYYFDRGHKDYITYPRTIGKGKWFFHPSGMDLSFESSCIEGFKKTSEAGNYFFGGILIRGLVKDGNNAIIGPLNSCWGLFDIFSAFEANPNELPIIEPKSVENQFEIFKSQRWIPFNEEKADKDYEGNFGNFKTHLPKLYRYYVKRQVLIKDKSKLYKAQPWKAGSEDKRVNEY